MKIRLKRLLIFIITIILLFINRPVLTASEIDPNFYKPTITVESDDVLKEKVGPILGIINTVGVVCSVIMIIVIGLKYMLGSVEQKAEYKKTMSAYLIGAFLLFSTTTVPNMVYNIIIQFGLRG